LNGGVHFFMGYRPGDAPYRVYRELAPAQANRFIDMGIYARYLDDATGRSLSLTRNLGRFARDVRAIAPADAPAFEALVGAAQAFRNANLMDMADPQELMTPLAKAKQMWGMRRLLRYFGGKWGQTAADYAKAVADPWLRQRHRGAVPTPMCPSGSS